MENRTKTEQNNMDTDKELISFMQELQELYPAPTLPEQLKKFNTLSNESTAQKTTVLDSELVPTQEARIPKSTRSKIYLLLFGNRRLKPLQVAIEVAMLLVVGFVLINLIGIFSTIRQSNLPIDAAVSNTCANSSGNSLQAATSENFDNLAAMPNLNLSQYSDGLTVTVHSVTADPNSIKVYITVTDGTPCPAYSPYGVSLTDNNGAKFSELPHSWGTTPFGFGGSLIFDSSAIATTTQTLQLELKIATYYKDGPSTGNREVPASFLFNLSAPFNTAQVHILRLNQVVVSSGVSITLNRVVITPNQTRFYFQDLGSNMDYELTANDFKLSSDGGPNNAGPGSASITTGSDGEIVFTLNYPLYDKYGNWILSFKRRPDPNFNIHDYAVSPTPVPSGPWTFHFTLSPSGN